MLHLGLAAERGIARMQAAAVTAAIPWRRQVN